MVQSFENFGMLQNVFSFIMMKKSVGANSRDWGLEDWKNLEGLDHFIIPNLWIKQI